MYSKLSRIFFLPFSDIIFGNKTSAYTLFLDKSQWWSTNKLQEYQNRKLRKLIKHAYKNVPYYNRVFHERDLHPNDIKSTHDLVKLPILTKEIIRNNGNDMLARNYKAFGPILNSTSGSTGSPLNYYITKENLSYHWASAYRGWGWGGYNLFDKMIFTGSSSLHRKKISSFRKVRSFFERIYPLSSFDLSPLEVMKNISRINNFNPDFLRGYPSSIYLIADFVEKQSVDFPKMSGVFTTGEKLYDFQRKKIESVLGCEILDGYGARDGGVQTYECKEHQGYHIGIESVVLEVIEPKTDKKDQSMIFGKIINTDLLNFSMPFIRYDSGDIGSPIKKEQCSCGRGLPLLAGIKGRQVEFLINDEGNLVPGLPLTDFFEEVEIVKGINAYQIIQEKNRDIRIKLVKSENFNERCLPPIDNSVKKHLGSSISVEYEYLDTISSSASGKFSVVKSKAVNEEDFDYE